MGSRQPTHHSAHCGSHRKTLAAPLRVVLGKSPALSGWRAAAFHRRQAKGILNREVIGFYLLRGFRARPRWCSRNRLSMKPLHRKNTERDEDRQDKKLHHRERRLLLRRSQRVPSWHLQEDLHDQHEDIEAESKYAAHHTRQAPAT